MVPIAGDLKGEGGSDLDATWEFLDAVSPPQTEGKENGLRVNIHGGFFGTGEDKRAQMAMVDFLCDKDKTGLENLWEPEADDQYTKRMSGGAQVAKDEDDAEEKKKGTNDKDTPSLRYIKYDTGSGEADVLHLEWSTKYACKDVRKEPTSQDGSHWGFFTWFIVM